MHIVSYETDKRVGYICFINPWKSNGYESSGYDCPWIHVNDHSVALLLYLCYFSSIGLLSTPNRTMVMVVLLCRRGK